IFDSHNLGRCRTRAQPLRPAGQEARAVLGSLGEIGGRDRARQRRCRMMKICATLVGALAATFAAMAPAAAETTLRVGWCARTVTSAAAPFAIAMKLGWFAKAGIKIDLIP